MILPAQLRDALRSLTGEVRNFKSASGGCINNGGIIQTGEGQYFLKWNDAHAFPRMLELEKKGLEILRETNTVRVPKTFYAGEVTDFQYLIMEVISPSARKEGYWKSFGEQLATLHICSARMFGLDHDNYIGSLNQKNTQEKSWIDFFIHHRLIFQVELASRPALISPSMSRQFERLYQKLPSLLPDEKPALLHGDLWGGNIMVDDKGLPCLIDPAIYYGHREMDLAMTTLFGGFDRDYIKSYNAVYPLSPGFDQRLPIYNLYPLLVHVNLFGAGYVSQVQAVLNRFT
jgi:protein-ribulosamine 3-kinase